MAFTGCKTKEYIKVPSVRTEYVCRTDTFAKLDSIYLSGGGALLRGLDKRLTEKINIPFHIAEDPLHSVAKGAGVALKNIERFSFLMR